jgi:hypothetical protein
VIVLSEPAIEAIDHAARAVAPAIVQDLESLGSDLQNVRRPRVCRKAAKARSVENRCDCPSIDCAIDSRRESATAILG